MKSLLTSILLLLFLLSSVQCTTTRWSVQELDALDEVSDPNVVDSEYTVLMTDTVSHENPFLTFDLYRVDYLEYPQRVMLERTLQNYRPRWGFALLSVFGASVAFYAGSTDRLVGTTSRQQSLAFYTAGTLLTVMAFTNMEPVGEPIKTGETRMMRESGSVVLQDTVQVDEEELADHPFYIRITWGEHVLTDRVYETGSQRGVSLRLTDLLVDHEVSGLDPGELFVEVGQNGTQETFEIPVRSFLRPVVTVTSDVAGLFSAASVENEPLTEAAGGSEFPLVSSDVDEWFQVQFGGSELYLHREDAEINWGEVERFAAPSIIPVTDIPFGEISVEFSVPELKTEADRDAAWLIENYTGNQVGIRRHLSRDMRLMELYFDEALAVPLSMIHTESIGGTTTISPDLRRTAVDSTSTLYVYITGFASIRNEDEDDRGIDLIHLNRGGEITRVDVEALLNELAATEAARLVIFADLEFQHTLSPQAGIHSGVGTGIYEELATRLQEQREETALIFSARPNQRSGLYESLRFDMKYHHLFPYYLAQGLQQRRTQLSSLVRFMENQVDYTSRRLHDRPQSVQAYGDLSIDLSDQSE